MLRARLCRSLAAFAFTLLVPQSARAADALNFFKNYFVTGDYVVGGIGLRGTGVNGLASGTIAMPADGVPAHADILAAFLYWQTVTTTASGSAAAGATFRGHDISTIARALNPEGTSPCWSSGGGTGNSNGSHRLIVYRADVLRFLPIGADGKLLVNTGHAVTLPDSGTGNSVPSTAGASLVVVYRDPAKPLKSIVIYDGGYTLDQSSQMMTQVIKGFYQSAPAPAARMTHIVGNGQANFPEQLLFNGTVIAPFPGPFTGAQGVAWDNPTFPNLSLAPGSASAHVQVDHGTFTPFDCLSWGAVVFSTGVQDTDADGLLDVWETDGLTDLNTNAVVVDLPAMGASPTVKDVFVEIGYMTTAGYVNPSQGVVSAHSHLPMKSALDIVATAFRRAPVDGLPGGPFQGISVHFDVGGHYQPPHIDPATGAVYPALPTRGQCRANWQPSCAIVPAALARGGEEIVEAACVPSATVTCQFPGDRGVVGWKSAYKFLRDQPLNGVTEPECGDCVRRFDRNRKDVFHYALFAHALGIPRSDTDDPSTPYDERHTPKNTSGIADPPGGDSLITLGYFDDFVGTAFMQATTFMHELGHNFGLRHGGPPLVSAGGQLSFQSNCKPNYQSVMNYMFQVGGLIDPNGDAMVDYSRQVLAALDENSVSEPAGLRTAAGANSVFRPRYYAPAASSYIDLALGTSPAPRHCDGSRLTPQEILNNVAMVRIDGTTVVPPLDWNADGLATTFAFPQDVSFNGSLTPLAAGSDDWSTLDLRQVGGRRNVGSRRIGGAMSLDLGFGDVGFGDVGFGDVGFGDVGFGDVGYGDVGFGDVGFGDVGFGDVGFGDVGFGDVGAPPGDVDFQTAQALGNAPSSLKGVATKDGIVLSWRAPHVRETAVNFYLLYRVIGTVVTPVNFASRVLVAQVNAPFTTVTDTTAKNNATYVYLLLAEYVDGTRSGVVLSAPLAKK